jgi:hypothetical protein
VVAILISQVCCLLLLYEIILKVKHNPVIVYQPDDAEFIGHVSAEQWFSNCVPRYTQFLLHNTLVQYFSNYAQRHINAVFLNLCSTTL